MVTDCAEDSQSVGASLPGDPASLLCGDFSASAQTSDPGNFVRAGSNPLLLSELGLIPD